MLSNWRCFFMFLDEVLKEYFNIVVDNLVKVLMEQ